MATAKAGVAERRAGRTRTRREPSATFKGRFFFSQKCFRSVAETRETSYERARSLLFAMDGRLNGGRERGSVSGVGQRGSARARRAREAWRVDGEMGTATRSFAGRAAPSRGGSSKALEEENEKKPDVWRRDRGAAGPRALRVGAERADAGRALSVHETRLDARNDTPRRTFRGQCAAERGGAGALREGGRHDDARRWVCARTPVKKRDGPTEFRGSVLGRKETCRCGTSGARATGLTRVRRQELCRAGGRPRRRRPRRSRVEEDP